MKCIVVNLFGVPSAGKSTGAAYIFSQLKMAGVNAELVTEFAKDLVWEENSCALGNQVYVFATQFHRMWRCSDKVEVLITDSPLPLSILYNQSDILGEAFNQTVMNCYNAFDNLNYFVLRDRPYNPKGRVQTEEEAEALKEPLTKLLNDYDISFQTIEGNLLEFDKVVDEVLQKLGVDTYLSKDEKPHVKFISYTGKYPNLCSGTLTLDIDGEMATFGDCYKKPKPQYDGFWEPGGSLSNDFCSCYHAPWKVDTDYLPKKFVKYASEIEQVFNENVEYGCCGGCI